MKNIRFHDETCFDILKASEQDKIKAYSCVVTVKNKIKPEDIEKLNQITDLKVIFLLNFCTINLSQLQQKTPLRVLHRRTQMVREKIIHRLKVRQINDYSLVITWFKACFLTLVSRS